jgi:hypothetical protein
VSSTQDLVMILLEIVFHLISFGRSHLE